jgi:hypothetical protein
LSIEGRKTLGKWKISNNVRKLAIDILRQSTKTLRVKKYIARKE